VTSVPYPCDSQMAKVQLRQRLKSQYRLLWSHVARAIGMSVETEREFELVRAYVQLGSVIINAPKKPGER
jgi:hypothetical protein